MTVLEAFNRVGIFNLPRKFKSFKTNTPYGEIYSCDLKFPRPFSDPDWCERKSHWGIPFGLWGKVAVRDKNKGDGIKTGKFFESDCIWLGRPHSNNNPNLELIYKDFVQTFWGQRTVDDLIWYHTREKFVDRKGAAISIYYDQSTELTILDGKMMVFLVVSL